MTILDLISKQGFIFQLALWFLQVHNGAPGEGGEHEGETYILLVDDDDENARAHLESLNSQTLYIDSSSLANGDLSNMVLMTGPPHTTEGEQVSVNDVTKVA